MTTSTGPGDRALARTGSGDDVGLLFVGTDGVVQRVDRAFCRLASVDAESVVGSRITDVWPDLDLSEEITAASALCQGNATYRTLVRRYPTPEGGEWRAEVALFRVPAEDGGAVISVRLRDLDGSLGPGDIPATDPPVRADETLLSFDQGKVGALIIGLDGRARRVNPAMCRICGRTPEEMLDLDLLAITHPDDQPRDVELSLAVWSGESDGWSHEKRILRPDGTTVWIQQEVAVVRDGTGRPAHFLAQAVDITHQKEIEASLRESRARVELLTRELPVGVLEIAPDGRIVAANPALVDLVGHDPVASGSRVTDLIDPRQVDRVVEGFLDSVADSEDWSGEFRLMSSGGEQARWVRAFVRSQVDDDGTFRSATGAWVDVTDEIATRRESARFSELLADVPDFVAIAATDGTVVYRNPAAATIIPSATDDALDLIGLFDTRSQERLLLDVVPAVEATGAWSGELTLRASDGTLRPVLASMTLHRDTTEVEYVTVIARDISDLKAVEDLLREQATRDALTGLVNRAAIHDAVDAALSRAPGRAAVLFVDLDLFKAVNDRFGHEAGDLLLVDVAQRLRRVIREHDVVGRIGGDEFVVLCRDASVEEATAVAHRIVDALAEPATWQGHEVAVGASVGLAAATPTDTAGSLLRRADEAVYVAKARGRSQVVVAGGDHPG